MRGQHSFLMLVALLCLLNRGLEAKELTVSTPSYEPAVVQFERVRTVRPGGPPSSYNEEQKYNFYLGRTYAALKICGYYSVAREIRALLTDRKAFARGEGTLAGADTMTNCHAVKRSADSFLGNATTRKSQDLRSEEGKGEIFEPPIEMRAKEFSSLYSFDGLSLRDGYMARGDVVQMLEKRNARCRIAIPYSTGWVDCDRLVPTN